MPKQLKPVRQLGESSFSVTSPDVYFAKISDFIDSRTIKLSQLDWDVYLPSRGINLQRGCRKLLDAITKRLPD